ncbi:MAG: SH3 domain-containing protein [Clostridia bacterium]|nr:SH3 domain-containing protein [Clostridia bacterium]
MKNSKIISAFFVILLVLLSSNIAFADTGIVNTPAARIREKASKDAEILTRAYEDDEVEILGEDGDWYQVKVNGKTGYVSKSLIKKKESTSNDKVENTVSDNQTNETTSENQEVPAEATPSNETTISSKTTIKEDTVARIMPNFASNELILLTKGTEIEVVREINNWTEIIISGRKAWILKNKVNIGVVVPNEELENTTPEQNTTSENNTTKPENTVVENTNTTNQNTTSENTSSEARNMKGIINVETANVRAKAESSSKIIDKLDEDDEVTIIAEEGDFYKITTSKIESGYVAKRLVTVADISSRGTVEVREKVEETKSEASTVQTSANKGLEVIEFAKQYLGYDYVLGGKTPETGFDCSGFTRYVFKNFGYSLGTVAADQTSLGTEIDKSNLKEGDLILFYNEENTKIGHTGIYIGNNEFIHAANPERGVVTDNLVTNSYYATRFVTARRIVE